MIDLIELRDSLREHTGTDEDDMPDTKADLLLNRAYWEILDKFHFREKEVTATFDIVAGTRLYNMPDPFDALRLLSVLNPDTEQHMVLKRMTIQKYEELYNESEDEQDFPTHYVREACSARLWPTPDADYTATIKYWTTLADLVEGTNETPPIPQSWHEIILFGGVWRAFVSFGDYVRGNTAKAHQSALIESAVPVEAKEEYDSESAGIEVPGRTGQL